MTPPLNIVRQLLETQMLSQIDADYQANVKSGNMIDNLADRVNFQIVSEATELSRQLSSREAVQSMVSSDSGPSLQKIVDNSKPIKTEIVHLIGNEQSPWVAAVLRNAATTRAGKPFKHEWVMIMEFDSQDRISTLKVYPDSHNLLAHSSDL
ncbi:uncharacterized protein F4807DRAFT_455964 [Annulohypoxylon truncatum]|uniref:uncharacterized protein n=1 Tax=Annulohypoxylon truncatum TaxID=327061 RepID=UPI002007E6F9|nr:uncharacterized protein F4807DRAFT_455964 [Annulohypoxylon truncatum]KAI1214323.1 hypothetical protein F4807DRAFT_455964 [Annulohypoxylon truncatum]